MHMHVAALRAISSVITLGGGVSDRTNQLNQYNLPYSSDDHTTLRVIPMMIPYNVNTKNHDHKLILLLRNNNTYETTVHDP